MLRLGLTCLLLFMAAGTRTGFADEYCSEAAGGECKAVEEIMPGASRGQADYVGDQSGDEGQQQTGGGETEDDESDPDIDEDASDSTSDE